MVIDRRSDPCSDVSCGSLDKDLKPSRTPELEDSETEAEAGQEELGLEPSPNPSPPTISIPDRLLALELNRICPGVVTDNAVEASDLEDKLYDQLVGDCNPESLTVDTNLNPET